MSQQTHTKLPEEVLRLHCTGADLLGCPDNSLAVYETKSDKTWKKGAVWIFVCPKCAEKLMEP